MSLERNARPFSLVFQGFKGETCQAIRALLSMTQSELADASGMSKRTLIRFENNEDVHSNTVTRIKNALSVIGLDMINHPSGVQEFSYKMNIQQVVDDHDKDIMRQLDDVHESIFDAPTHQRREDAKELGEKIERYRQFQKPKKGH